MKIYHKIHSNQSLGFFVELTDKERNFLNYKFETRNLYVKEISELMNIHRNSVYLYFEDKDICLYRFLQIQEILNFEIVSKKDIDNFMNKFYQETIKEVKRWRLERIEYTRQEKRHKEFKDYLFEKYYLKENE